MIDHIIIGIALSGESELWHQRLTGRIEDNGVRRHSRNTIRQLIIAPQLQQDIAQISPL